MNEIDVLTNDLKEIKKTFVSTPQKGYKIQITVIDQETNQELKGELDTDTIKLLNMNEIKFEPKDILWEIVEGLIKVCEDSKKL